MASDRRADALAVAIVFVGAAARLYGLAAESLTSDEAYSLHFVRSYGPAEFLARYPTIDPHPPLYYLLLDGWTTLFGTSEFVARFPSAAFGVAAIAVTYLLGRRAFDGRVGLVAAALLALSTLHVYHSQEVRMYGLHAFAVALSTYAFVLAVESPTRRRVAAYAAATILLLYTHVFAAFTVLAHVLALSLYRHRALRTLDVDRLRPWLGAYLAVGLAYLPVAVLVLRQALLVRSEGVFISWIEPPAVAAILRAITTYVGYQSETLVLLARTAPLLALATIPVAVAAYGALARPGTESDVEADGPRNVPDGGSRLDALVDDPTRRWTLLLVLWVATVHVVPWVLSYLVTPVYVSRYTLSASIATFLLAGIGVQILADVVDRSALPGVGGLRGQHVAWALALVLVAALLVPYGSYYGDHQRDQWRDAVEHVDASADGDDVVLVVSDSPDLADLRIVYRYYADRRASSVVPIGSKNESSYDRVAEMAGGYDRIWLLAGRSHSVTADERDRFVDVLGEDCEPVEARDYSGVDLRAFDCPGGTA